MPALNSPRTTRWLVAAAVLAVLAAVGLLLLPATQNVSPAGVRTSSLLQTQGLAALPSLLGPVAVATLPMAVRGPERPVVAWVAAVLMAVFVVLAAASVGLYFLPSAACLGVAAFRGGRG